MGKSEVNTKARMLVLGAVLGACGGPLDGSGDGPLPGSDPGDSEPAAELDVTTSEAALYTSSLIETVLPGSGENHVILRLPPIDMVAGEKHFFAGSWRPRSNTTAKIMQGFQIYCSLGAKVYRSYSSNTNHYGTTGPLYSASRWLFAPPGSGRYTCELRGKACSIPSCADASRQLLVSSADAHSLQHSLADPGAASWREAADRCLRPGVSHTIMPFTWTASPAARRIDVDLDVQITTVIKSPTWTDSYCQTFYADNNGSTAQVTLSVVQLNAAGSACAPAYQTPIKYVTIARDTHHTKALLSLRDVPVSASAACTRTFSINGKLVGRGSTIFIQQPGSSTGIVRNKL